MLNAPVLANLDPGFVVAPERHPPLPILKLPSFRPEIEDYRDSTSS